MIEACFTCEEIAEDGESLDCDHKHYRYEKVNKNQIGFLDTPDLEFGEPV